MVKGLISPPASPAFFRKFPDLPGGGVSCNMPWPGGGGASWREYRITEQSTSFALQIVRDLALMLRAPEFASLAKHADTLFQNQLHIFAKSQIKKEFQQQVLSCSVLRERFYMRIRISPC